MTALAREVRCPNGHLRAVISGQRIQLECKQCTQRARINDRACAPVRHEWIVLMTKDGGIELQFVAGESACA